MTRCAGSDVQADSPVCPACEKTVDRYRDDFCGQPRFRFVEHSREMAEPPAELVTAILRPERSPFDDLEETLIRCAQGLQEVASGMGDLTNASDLHALQIRVATVSSLSESIELDLMRLRRSAA